MIKDIPKYKVFNGKRYSIDRTSLINDLSLKEARQHRDSIKDKFGGYYRIVKIGKGYRIYVTGAVGYTKARKAGFPPAKIKRKRK